MDSLIMFLAAKLGVTPELVPLYVGLIIAAANLLGKRIPASATGPLGLLRQVALVVGLYIPQRLTPRVTTQNVTAAIAAEVDDSTIKVAAEQLPAAVATNSNITGGIVSTALDQVVQSQERNL